MAVFNQYSGDWQGPGRPIILLPPPGRPFASISYSIELQNPTKGLQPLCFFVMGTVGLFLALECVNHSPASALFAQATIVVISALNVSLSFADLEVYRSLLTSFSTFLCIEDDAGALYAHLCQLTTSLLPTAPPRILSKRISKPGPSCRTFASCLQFHDFTVAGIRRMFE